MFELPTDAFRPRASVHVGVGGVDGLVTIEDLVEELNFGLILVCHLRRIQDKNGHEEGAMTSLSHLRGSHGLAQLTDICCGLERSQQNEETKDILTIRVLKNRYTGDTGVACSLHYNRETGRLSEGDFSDV